MKYLSQGVAYAVFGAVVGLLSVWPRYELLGLDEAIVSLTFSHAAQRVGACRVLTQEELDKLPPNMRRPSDCPRERHPIRVEFRADGTVVHGDTVPPSGFWSDGKASVYRRLRIGAGPHELFIGMNDTGTAAGFDYELTIFQELSPGQHLVIDFDEVEQKFILR